MGLASCTGAAFLAMLVWAEEPSLGHGALFGFCVAMALLSKFTAIGFFPASAAIAILFYLASARPGFGRLKQLARERLGSLLLAIEICFLVCWGTFFFSLGKLPFWNVVLPAREYIFGVYVALLHNHGGHTAYLLGQHSRFGWWYYFPVGLAVKTPLALLVLASVGTAVSWNNRRRLPYLLPFAFVLGILLPAMVGNVNIGVRHVLPVYLGLAIIAALGLDWLLRMAYGRRWAGALAGVLVLWLAATGAIHHPNYLSYFNELVPYPQHRVLCDSDYDWGQDLARLGARLRELGATEVNYGLIGAEDTKFIQAYSGLPRIIPINPMKPAEGWTAICPTLDHARQYGLYYRDPNIRPWYQHVPVRERVGTIDLLYLPPGSLK
jgi:4-amino-4-deoxy-L-arabinose transferase-like glycosyltransferase